MVFEVEDYAKLANHIRDFLDRLEVGPKTSFVIDGRYFEVGMDTRIASAINKAQSRWYHSRTDIKDVFEKGGCTLCLRGCDNYDVAIILANLAPGDRGYDYKCRSCSHMLSHHQAPKDCGDTTVFDVVSNSWITVGRNPQPFKISASPKEIRETLEGKTPDGLARGADATPGDSADSQEPNPWRMADGSRCPTVLVDVPAGYHFCGRCRTGVDVNIGHICNPAE